MKTGLVRETANMNRKRTEKPKIRARMIPLILLAVTAALAVMGRTAQADASGTPDAVIITEEHADSTIRGGYDGSITVTASGGSGAYDYSRDGGATWQGSPSFAWLAAGKYRVMARDQMDQANVSDAIEVTIGEPDAVSVKEEHRPVTTSGGNNGGLSAAASGGRGIFEYSKDGGLNWQDSSSFSGLPVGFYKVMARDKEDKGNISGAVEVVLADTAVDAGAFTGALSGTLTDSAGKPVSGYYIALFSEPRITATDGSGKFVFTETPYTSHVLVIADPDKREIGRYKLVFTGIGAEADAAQSGVTAGNGVMRVVFADNATGVDISLQMNVERSGIGKVSGQIAIRKVPEPDSQNTGWLWIFLPGLGLTLLAALWLLWEKKGWFKRAVTK